MSKAPFDSPARNKAKITRKAKKEKLKALNKVFGTDFKLHEFQAPPPNKTDSVLSQWSPDKKPKHVKPKIEPMLNLPKKWKQLMEDLDTFIEEQNKRMRKGGAFDMEALKRLRARANSIKFKRDLIVLMPMLICVALLYLSSLFI